MSSSKAPKSNQNSWPNRIFKRLLNLSASAKENTKSTEEQAVHRDCVGRRKSCSDKDDTIDFLGKKRENSNWDLSTASTRMFVGTWNVSGRATHDGLNLKDWLCTTTTTPADIYVLGFQEIVALNAGNILVNKEKKPDSTGSWLSLIHNALNEEASSSRGGSLYQLAGSKRMVGIFLCVWLRAEFIPHVSGLEVSSIARGIMGYVGNKGSISMSMTLMGTSFCFVCVHLAAGNKERDEMKRNDDVTEILKKTKFDGEFPTPTRILDHDTVVFLGDLNYRLTNSTHRETVESLVSDENWETLLEKDQLRINHKAGRIFTGWEEGKISFPPTYKYQLDSHCYSSKSRCIPAWCDRILWTGDGISQSAYNRSESTFSDHRPVNAVFNVKLRNKTEATIKAQSCRFEKHDNNNKIFQET
ncbi:hypothetical protein ZOSMA_93G00830 [Zostera marina]|uniref:Inositol polyphosphate-related phosphatase domain-containing protein n=1 Tax=Zostera marina TaxID=29655 RepID=A0A0K9NIQ2_ZOSMR|nr:hypothetical protein ZOSMA_93G00830 [Zostera marina]